MRTRHMAGWLVLAAVAGMSGCYGTTVGGELDRELEPPAYADRFWKRWGDGRAEIATYDLVFPRYGSPREGTAVAIFVTEPFSMSVRVKADPGRHPDDDVIQVMKLNLVKDFPTGLYDYNTMLSAFVALQRFDGVPAGTPIKLSYSSQEWCGHVYHQVLFDRDGVRESLHSYFDGEADAEGTLARPVGGMTEDALYLWARGLAAPTLAPGESRAVPLLRTLQDARLHHRPLEWRRATLSRSDATIRIEVPAGGFEVDRYRAEIEGGGSWTFDVSSAAPHHLIRWEFSEGERAELVAVDRLRYWERNGPDDLEDLRRIGLQPRPPRTP